MAPTANVTHKTMAAMLPPLRPGDVRIVDLWGDVSGTYTTFTPVIDSMGRWTMADRVVVFDLSCVSVFWASSATDMFRGVMVASTLMEAAVTTSSMSSGSTATMVDASNTYNGEAFGGRGQG